MPRYYTYKNQVKLGPGQKLNYTRGKGYWVSDAKGAHVDAMDPMQAEASSSVEAAIAPILAALERQRADAREQAGLGQQRLADYYKWASGEAKSIAPQIQGQYNQAAQTTGAFGKGFSQGMQDALGASAAQGNAMLAQNGAPAGQQLGGGIAAAGDALYGLSGALPAQELSQQGAAFSAAAAQLPATAAGVGGQALQDLIRQDKDADDEWTAQIAEIEQKRPGLIKEAMNELRDLSLKERDQALKEAAYEFDTGLKVRKQDFDEAATTARIANEKERIALQRSGLVFKTKQAETKAAEAVAKGARPNAGLSAKYGYIVDSNGVPILDAKGKRIPVAKTTRGSSGKPTPQQKSVILKRATDVGNDALEKLKDRIFDGVPGAFEPAGWDEKKDGEYENSKAYAKASQIYRNRLRSNYGKAVADVSRAIAPHLRAAGWTKAQILAEARRLVELEIKPWNRRR